MIGVKDALNTMKTIDMLEEKNEIKSVFYNSRKSMETKYRV